MTQTTLTLRMGISALMLFAGTASPQQTSQPPAAAQTNPAPAAAPGRGGFGRGGQPFDYADNEGWI